jgi:hypothetical protein
MPVPCNIGTALSLNELHAALATMFVDGDDTPLVVKVGDHLFPIEAVTKDGDYLALIPRSYNDESPHDYGRHPGDVTLDVCWTPDRDRD